MAQLLGSTSFGTVIRPQSITRQCVTARPAVRSVRRAVQQAPSLQTVDTTPTRASVVLRAVRADQQTDTVDNALLQTIAQITEKVDEAVASTMAASAEAAKALDVSTSSELRDKVVTAVEKLQKGLLERETEVGSTHAQIFACCNPHLRTPGTTVAVPLLVHQNQIAADSSSRTLAVSCLLTMHHRAAGSSPAAGIPVRRAPAVAWSSWYSQVRAGAPAERPGSWCLL